MKTYKCKPCKCPSCGGKVGKIMWGKPIIDNKLEADIAAGKIILGGCCVTDDDPTWQCAKCGEQFWKA